MSSVTQPRLFSWGKAFSWGKVDRSAPIVLLGQVLDALPDDALLESLARERRGKRNDYPLEALWRAVVAGALLGHPTRAALIAELRRNGELREVCGFDPARGERAVPPPPVFSRFCTKLARRRRLLDEMIASVVDLLAIALPDLGKDLAMDAKALVVRGRKPADAETATKVYETVGADGVVRERKESWFGYKLHLLVDVRYELPVGFEVTRARCGDSPRLMPMVERLAAEHPEIHKRAETMAADKAYDDGADKADLLDNHGIKPLIPPREMSHEDGGMRPLEERRSDTVYISPTGEVSCKIAPFDPDPSKVYAPMAFWGYEHARGTLKFRCPATAYGLECQNREACRCNPRVRDGQWGRVVRVPLERERRLLLPTYAPSYAFARAYKGRTAVERVNSRLDRVHGLEWALVDSQAAMTLRVSLSILAMLASALGWLRANRPEMIRKLLRAA